MKQVAQMLGVELGEEFGIVNGYYKYRITELGVEYYDELNQCWTECNYKMAWLLNGSDEIIKLPKPILDEAEKRYLSNVIKPFRDKVSHICKSESSNTGMEWIHVGIKADVDLDFPNFEMGTMYKGMEIGKRYSLSELGL